MSAPQGSTYTYLFADIVGSTSLLERGDPDIAGAMASMSKIMGDSIRSANADSTTFTGDGFMAAFPSAVDAVDFARSVMDWSHNPRIDQRSTPPIGLRIGLNTGSPERVLQTSHIGLAISLASRICDAANSGQILLSGSTRAALGGGYPEDHLHRLGTFRLAGNIRSTELWSLVGEGLTSSIGPTGGAVAVEPTPAWWEVQDEDHLDQVIAQLESIAGIVQAKNEVLAFLERAELAIRTGPGSAPLPLDVDGPGIAPLPLDMDMVFLGPRGSGKSLVARLLGEALTHLGVLARPELVTIDAVEFARMQGPVAEQTMEEARGALVFFTNVDRLADLVDTDEVAASLYAGPFMRLVDLLHHQRELGLTARLPAHRQLFVVLPLRNHESLDRLRRWGAGLDELYGRRVVFAPLSQGELVEAFERHARLAGFAIDPEGLDALRHVIADPTRGIDGARAVGWLFDQARMSFAVRCARMAHQDDPTDAPFSSRVLMATDIDWTPDALA